MVEKYREMRSMEQKLKWREENIRDVNICLVRILEEKILGNDKEVIVREQQLGINQKDFIYYQIEDFQLQFVRSILQI